MRPEIRAKGKLEQEFTEKLHPLVTAMVAMAQLQSKQYAQDYWQAVQVLEETSARSLRWVFALLIERYGGWVWAASRVGEGATCHFSLPHEVA